MGPVELSKGTWCSARLDQSLQECRGLLVGVQASVFINLVHAGRVKQ